jgi:hypothetical protein
VCVIRIIRIFYSRIQLTFVHVASCGGPGDMGWQEAMLMEASLEPNTSLDMTLTIKKASGSFHMYLPVMRQQLCLDL